METLAHLFIPRTSNNHKAKLIQAPSLILILVVIIFAQFALTLFSQAPVRVLGYASQISVDEVIKLTNQKREANGLSDVELDPLLMKAAQEKATDMIAKGYWAHVAPDGTQPWHFFEDVGYKYKYAGENLARDFKNAPSAVDAWMASTSHRENMLSSRYKEIGVAVIDGQMAGSDTTIIVQLFGTKLSEVTPVMGAEQAPPAKPITQNTTPEAPIPAVAPAQVAQVLAKPAEVAGISSFDVTKATSIGLTILLVTIIVVDGFIVAKNRIVRLGGRPLAHLSFFGMIIAILIIAKAGRIL